MSQAQPRYLPGVFRVGDRVQLTDPRGKINTITLEPDGEFHTHRGVVRHESIIGLPDGSVVLNSSGVEYLALRPLLVDFVMSMPRGAAIIYPKEAQVILGQADIFPGATVVEAGVGSGGLSLWLLRAIGPSGTLHSFERREEFAEIAQANVDTYFGFRPENWNVVVGDLADQLVPSVGEGKADRIVLDMLAPWECIDSVADALIPGGVVLMYVATVTQLSRTVEALRASGCFTHPESTETIVRGWHVEGLAVRPEHRMIGHTAFIVTARRLAPGAVLPDLKRRASKSDFTDEDVEAWTPGVIGGKELSPKSLRKRVKAAQETASKATSTESID